MGSENQPQGAPQDVAAIRLLVRRFLNTLAPNGKKIGNAKWGVYAFYDYDGDPIYVGQTNERLRSGISRHLTNQRTDAVAMNVLDPFEVADIEVRPLWDLPNENSGDGPAKLILNSAECCIIPEELYDQGKHPDVRNARRATTIAALARVFSERRLSKGLRRTTMTQTVRLQELAPQRHKDTSGAVPSVDPGEEV